MVKKIKKRTRMEKAKINKLRLVLQFSSASLSETEVIYEECLKEFGSRFHSGEGDEATEDSGNPAKSPEDAGGEPQEATESDPGAEEKSDKNQEKADEDMKKIYRKIALSTHPDKLLGVDQHEAEHKIELYKSAVSAMENRDGGGLLKIAHELSIEIDMDFEKEIMWIEKKVAELQDEINRLYKSDAWLWYHSEGEKKENIEKFVKERTSS